MMHASTVVSVVRSHIFKCGHVPTTHVTDFFSQPQEDKCSYVRQTKKICYCGGDPDTDLMSTTQ